MENKNINLKKLIKSIGSKKIKDYIYLTIFFVIFSIFIIFAIRPALVTAFSLKREEKELMEKNLTYQKAIADASENLFILEDVRDRLFLVDEAIPDSPQINKVVDDIGNASNQNSLLLRNIFVSEKIEYVDSDKKNFQEVRVNLETLGNFENIINMINALNSQRRLKNINNMEIFSQSDISTESGVLDIQTEIIGFYL
ncbi:MAG: type 4a pilus biogenesis protein PilO [Patescibacteria group bacterium]